MLQIEKVSKTYHSKGIDYPVLKEISATIHDGEFVAIMLLRLVKNAPLPMY